MAKKTTVKKTPVKKSKKKSPTIELKAYKSASFEADITLAEGVNLSVVEVEKKLTKGKWYIDGNNVFSKKTGDVKATLSFVDELDVTYSDFNVTEDE